MSIIVDVIVEYLNSNRKLVVPAFGAFMVKESGERVFSDLLRADDGVLASLLQAKGLNEMEAAVTIDRFVFEVRDELEHYGYCRLDVLGTLRVEPDSGAVRLYPQVLGGEEPQEAPYIPEPIAAAVEEAVEDTAEPAEEKPAEEKPVEEKPAEEKPVEEKAVAEEAAEERPVEEVNEPAPNPTPARQRGRVKSRSGVDFVMIFAIIIVIAALAVVGYGWYVSSSASLDSEQAEPTTTQTEQTVNE